MNPSTGSPVTKPNASPNVAAAAEAIAARVRDSQFIGNTSPTKSPEKSLIKDHHHRRLQSISNITVKDLSSGLENGKILDRSPERSPDRSRSSSSLERLENKTPTKSEPRLDSLPPIFPELGKEVQSSRPMPRQPLKAILGETPPQSATMKALQGKANEDNEAMPAHTKRDSMALVRTPQPIEAISSQILSLTTIATNLQQEMAQLSRRSRDNATDLVSLKEATSSRDEDIRKTLRELVANLNTKKDDMEAAKKMLPRTNGPFYIDEKPHFSPNTPKNITLPRIPSPASFAASLDRELISSPSPYSMDGAATIALLEKILREMGTMEGQEHIKHAISELSPRESTSFASVDITKKLEEIVCMLKENSENRAIIRLPDAKDSTSSKVPERSYDYSLHPAVALARAGRNASASHIPSTNTNNDLKSSIAPEFVNEEATKLIKRIKDSVTESGGLTNEVKALVRELRGEVLGMGREIGRKLDAVEKNSNNQSEDNSTREQMFEVVEDGLTQLRKHMDDCFREHRRQSSASVASKHIVDSQEIQTTVQTILRELQLSNSRSNSSSTGREEILEAVRDAWETYKPEIEVKNVGLEPDEILECLEKGLQDYKLQLTANSKGATYEDVLDAVKQGLQDFKIPSLETEPVLTREEIMATMRECMETYDMPSRSDSSRFLSREDLLDAVKDGFINHTTPPREIELNRDDLFDAVRAGIQEVTPTEMSDQILSKVQDLIGGMRDEFLKHPAANSEEKEQILDVIKEGLESLRANVETYVDRAADVTGKDEIIDTVKDSLENLRADLEVSIANSRGPAPTSSGELLDVMEKEFEHLRTSLNASLARSETNTGGREELLDALRDGFEELKSSKSGLTGGDIEQEIRHLRETIASTMIRSGGNIDREEILEAIRDGIDRMQLNGQGNRSESIISSTDELLDALQDGFGKLKISMEEIVSKEGIEVIRSDIDRVVNEINRPIDMTVNYEILDLLKAGLASVQADTARLVAQQETTSDRGKEVVVADEQATKSSSRLDIENLEVMITQLKIKVDALDNQRSSVDHMALRPDFESLESMVKDLQDSVQNMNVNNPNQSAHATKDDINAIETILLNSKAKIDELSIPDAADLAKAIQIESLETLLKDLSHAVDDLTLRQEDNLPSKTEFGKLEILVGGLQTSLKDAMGKIESRLQDVDLAAVESLVIDCHDRVKELVPEGEKVASQSALLDIQTLVKDLHDQAQIFQDKLLLEAELTAQAFEARKIEHGGLADKIDDVKAFLESVRMELKSKIESEEQGFEGLALTLTTLGEALTAANAVESLADLKELIEKRFKDIHDSHEAGLESHQDFLMEKQDAYKNVILEELTAKLDVYLGEVIAKYDNMHATSSARSESFEEKTRDGIDAMLSTKAIADDLKLLVDTLGQTVTESCRNIAEDSKTVFTKVDLLANKQDVGFANLTTELKEDHQLTRTDLARASSTIDNIYGMVAEHNPKVMEAIHDVLNVMSQHFEMAQKSTEEIKTSVKELPASVSLPALPAPVSASIPDEGLHSVEKYDDTDIHLKLDKLVQLAANAGHSAAHIDLLEQIKDQVGAVAARFDAFSESKSAMLVEDEQPRTKEVEETNVVLEKRIAQQQAVEVEIVRLASEKDELHETITELKGSVASLREEEKHMMNVRAKLQAELSSLETALQIRKEDMHVMESRAEKLERRIIDGVLDQSRSALLGNRPSSSLNAMNLKRVTSTSSQATTTRIPAGKPTKTEKPIKSSTTSTTNVLSNTVEKALKRRQIPSAAASPAGSIRADRRILSLSTISGNKGSSRDPIMDNSAKAAKSNLGVGLGALKRSHSVKSSLPSRNTSWGGIKQLDLGSQISGPDKENSVLEEEDESSDAGLDRRSSFSGNFSDAELDAESYASKSITGSVSNISRQLRYSTSSLVAAVDESDREELEDVSKPGNELQLYTGTQVFDEGADDKHMVLFGKDSGIGSELPTASFENNRRFFADAHSP